MNTLNYGWRVAATGFCFATFSIAGLVMGFIIIPLASLVVKQENQKKLLVRQLIHRFFRAFVRMMSLVGVFAFDTGESEKILAGHHGKIIIANHPSLIDVVVLISLMPHADCIVKNALWDDFFMGRVVRAAGYIRNSGDIPGMLQACRQALDAGFSLIIFPEGTRTCPGSANLALQRGASNIALRCNVDIVPVLIRCTPTTLTKNEKWYQVPPTKALFSLRVHRPLEVPDFEAHEARLAVRARHLTSVITQFFTEKLRTHA